MNIILYIIELFVAMFKSSDKPDKKPVFKVKVRKSSGIVTRWDLEIKNFIDDQYMFDDKHFNVCKRIVKVIDISINEQLSVSDVQKIEHAVETHYRNKLVLDNCIIDFV